MNADGDVDAWDYAFAKWNYTGTQAAAPPGAPIPEPHALALLLAGGLAVLRRRR